MAKAKKKSCAANSPEATADGAETTGSDAVDSADIEPCLDQQFEVLKQKLTMIETFNDALTLKIERSKREINRIRLKRALLHHEDNAKSLRAKVAGSNSRDTENSTPAPNPKSPQVTSSQDNDAYPDPPAPASADENCTNL
ncbi:hypothetical protein RUND412_007196 [Rhizina undulata]